MMTKRLCKVILLCAMLLAARNVMAECPVCELANGMLQFRQRTDTENIVRDYFDGIAADDTLYVVVVPVGVCPRCENMIMPIIEQIKSVKPDAVTAIIAGYPDETAARVYLQRYGMHADIEIFDTIKRYEDFLSCNMGIIHVPILLKVIPESGDIPLVVTAFSNSEDLIRSFVYDDIDLGTYSYPYDMASESLYTPQGAMMSPISTYLIERPDSVVYSHVHMQPDFNDEMLAFHDKLDYSIRLVKLDAHESCIRHYATVKTDSCDNKKFIELPERYTERDYDAPSLRYIPLSPRFTPDGKLVVSYSLPHLWEIENGVIGYRNQPCLLSVDTATLKHTLLPLEEGDSLGLFFGHYAVYPFGENFAMMSQPRTWPLGERADYENDPCNNPFDDEYYKDKFVLSVFSSQNGRFICQTCPLSMLAAKSKTGHAFSHPISDTFGDAMVMCDGYSGDLYLQDNNGTRVYKAFEIDESELPVPESSRFYSFDISKQFEPYFCRHIDDLKLGSDYIVCILRYGALSDVGQNDERTVVFIDRKTGEYSEHRFPKPSAHVLAYGLRRCGGMIRPFRMLREADGCWSVELY